MILYDSHCHLDFAEFDVDRDAVWARARSAGVRHAFVPGYAPEQWSRLADLRSHVEGISAGVGLHPFALREAAPPENLERSLKAAAEQLGAVAIGECGLHKPSSSMSVPMQTQEAVLRAHLGAAMELGLPLVLHVVQAHGPALALLRCALHGTKHQSRDAPRGVVHAYSGSLEVAAEYQRLGFLLAFGGALTHPHHKRARAVAKALPLEALLLESDAPSAPAASSPSRNEPMVVASVAQALADLRGIKAEDVARVTTANALILFGPGSTHEGEAISECP